MWIFMATMRAGMNMWGEWRCGWPWRSTRWNVTKLTSTRVTRIWVAFGHLLRSFFFQAEDGIRDVAVTGVQTCALPISDRRIDRDVVALGGPRWRPVATRDRVDDPIDHRLSVGPQHRAVCRRRCTGPTPRLDDAIEPKRDEPRPQDDFHTVARRREPAVGPRLRDGFRRS